MWGSHLLKRTSLAKGDEINSKNWSLVLAPVEMVPSLDPALELCREKSSLAGVGSIFAIAVVSTKVFKEIATD